ncbi:hypothetical protein C1645_829150 [Glomus cerebriforme]|uniref:Uncharacterized protein n=1 Tax=Glomus cerebriforme TaxID=658196 RepID=A0A397SUU3_9GLOM|nr:hypothetical protein C1645_829150 [Glomus cerebriforme]
MDYLTRYSKNESETKDSKSDNKDIYKLNVSDPLNYKWSLLASFDSTDTSTTPTPTNSSAPIQTDVSVGAGFFNNFGLKARWIVAILIILVALVCISIFVTYRVRRYRNKNKILNTTNQQKLSSSDELEKNLI